MKSHFALAMALAAFVPAAALAQSQDEQQACMNDAFTVCGHAIPDRDRVASCLAQNFSRISPGCRMVMARYGKAPSRRERMVEPDDRYNRGYDRDDQFYRDDWFGRTERRDPYGRY